MEELFNDPDAGTVTPRDAGDARHEEAGPRRAAGGRRIASTTWYGCKRAADRASVDGRRTVRLLDAGVARDPRQGPHATTVDDLCATAGVTKGAFFHHFDSKETFAVAAADHWSAHDGGAVRTARRTTTRRWSTVYLGYVDFRASLSRDRRLRSTAVSPAPWPRRSSTPARPPAACGASILDHAATLEADIAEALIVGEGGARVRRPPASPATPRSSCKERSW